MLLKKDVFNAKIKSIEDEIPDITNVATNTTLNAKINELKSEIPSITSLTTNASLNTKIKINFKVKHLVLLTYLQLLLLLLLKIKYLLVFYLQNQIVKQK